MGLTVAKGESKGDFAIPKKGMRLAVLSGLIDLGIQDGGEWKGEKKEDKAMFLPILTLVKDTYEDKEGETKHMVTSPYPIRVNPGASRGNMFDFCEALDPNHDVMESCAGPLQGLIGRPCYVKIVHEEVKDKGTYANCKGFSECPDDIDVSGVEYNEVIFDTGLPDKEVFSKLWPSTQNWIRRGVKYSGSDLEEFLDGDEEPAKKEIEDDDIPF